MEAQASVEKVSSKEKLVWVEESVGMDCNKDLLEDDRSPSCMDLFLRFYQSPCATACTSSSFALIPRPFPSGQLAPIQVHTHLRGSQRAFCPTPCLILMVSLFFVGQWKF